MPKKTLFRTVKFRTFQARDYWYYLMVMVSRFRRYNAASIKLPKETVTR